MINFVVRDEKKDQNIEKTRQLAVKVTTIVLGLYIIAMGGFLGWNFYWNLKEQKTSTEEVQLRQEIKTLANREAMAIKLADRAEGVNEYYDSRGQAASEAARIPREDYQIREWEYKLGGDRVVLIGGNGPVVLKEYEDYMLENYKQVRVEKVLFEPEDGWTLELLVSGMKQP